MTNRIIKGYAAAGHLVAAYEAIDCDTLYVPVRGAIPDSPSRVIDIGAGSGRDAAWLAGMGHAVTAVEPVARFRMAGQRLHAGTGVFWIDDQLPALETVMARGARFDLVLLSGVWQHLSPAEREIALPRLAALMAPGAAMIVSLRHGPGAPGRDVFPIRDAEFAAGAQQAGLHVETPVRTGSVQPANRAAGVRWTWMVLRRGGPAERKKPGRSTGSPGR